MGSPVSSPTVWRSASRAARAGLFAALVAACAGGGGLSGATEIAFTGQQPASQSNHDGLEPLIVVAADASAKARLGALIQGVGLVADDRALVAAFEGQQRTGGYAIRIQRIVRSGNTLDVHATFESPPPDAFTIQVLTSPVHLVSVSRADIAGVVRVRLVDTTGKERATSSL